MLCYDYQLSNKFPIFGLVWEDNCWLRSTQHSSCSPTSHVLFLCTARLSACYLPFNIPTVRWSCPGCVWRCPYKVRQTGLTWWRDANSDLNCYQSGRRDLSPPQLVTFLEIKLSKGLRTNILQCISIHSLTCLIFFSNPQNNLEKKPSYNLAVLRVTRQWLE